MSRIAERRSDAVANQSRVIAAAKELFAERGMAAEMKDIADRAGVGVGTIYRNFPNKSDLVTAVLHAALADLERGFSDAEAEADPLVGLHRAVTCLHRAYLDHGWLIESAFLGQAHAAAAEPGNPLAKPEFQGIPRLLRRAIALGQVRDDIDIELTHLLLFGTVAPWSCGIIGRAEGGRSPAETARAVLDLLLRGIATPRSDRS